MSPENQPPAEPTLPRPMTPQQARTTAHAWTTHSADQWSAVMAAWGTIAAANDAAAYDAWAATHAQAARLTAVAAAYQALAAALEAITEDDLP